MPTDAHDAWLEVPISVMYTGVAAGAPDAWLCSLISVTFLGSIPTDAHDAWLDVPISVRYRSGRS